jgi:hypothetical protein
VTAGEGEEGIHVAMILKGYEQARGSQALIQGVMVMAMGGKKTVAPSQVGEYYRWDKVHHPHPNGWFATKGSNWNCNREWVNPRDRTRAAGYNYKV